jgi:hypothetical protein
VNQNNNDLDLLSPKITYKEFRKARAARTTLTADLHRLYRQATTILSRELGLLMDASYKKRLLLGDAELLIRYTKTIMDLRKYEEESLKGLTDAQLEEIANPKEKPNAK